jgi:hypothetical protein
MCPANEKCGKYIYKGANNNALAYLEACVLEKYCGIKGAELGSGPYGGRYYYLTDFDCPDSATP